MGILKQAYLAFIHALLLLLCIPTPTPFCEAQADAVQIVAQAALCFDNRPVMNGCLQSMGINIPGLGNNTSGSGSGSGSGGGGSSNSLSPSSSATGMCGAPCYGQMMLMMTCVDGILSNMQGYQSGLMQGVQAIFQMSCGTGGGAGGGGSGSGSGSTGGGTGGGGSTSGSAGGGQSQSQSGSTTNGSGSHLASRGQGNSEEATNIINTNGIALTTPPNFRFSLIILLFLVLYV